MSLLQFEVSYYVLDNVKKGTLQDFQLLLEICKQINQAIRPVDYKWEKCPKRFGQKTMPGLLM